MSLAADFGLSEVLSVVFVVGLFAIWVALIILLVGDLFADPELSGAAKAGWLVLILVLPLIGIFAYLVVRGDKVGRRVGATLAADEAADD